MNTNQINNYQDLFNFVGQLHNQYNAAYENILQEIAVRYDHIISDENLNVPEIRAILQPQIPKKPSPKSRRNTKRSDICENNKKSRTNSANSFKTASSNATFYLDAIDESPKTSYFDVNDKSSKHMENKLNVQLEQEEPEDGKSFLKDTICSLDFNNPAGTSTPTSPDFIVDTTSNDNRQPETQESANNPKHKLNLKILQKKDVNVDSSKSKLEEAQKKRTNLLRNAVETTKMKREERTQKVAAKREAVERTKRQITIKLEKAKAEKRFQIQKKRNEKLKLRDKPENLKPLSNSKSKIPSKPTYQQTDENELMEYCLDHLEDSYSSEDEEHPKQTIPRWAKKENLEHPLNVQSWLDKPATVYKWFHNDNLKSPKFEELFTTRMKLRPRTSSAVWHK